MGVQAQRMEPREHRCGPWRPTGYTGVISRGLVQLERSSEGRKEDGKADTLLLAFSLLLWRISTFLGAEAAMAP